MFFIVENLLSEFDLNRIQVILKSARFIDGSVTGSSSKLSKNNLEMEVGESYLSIAEIINEAIDSSQKIDMRMVPRFRTNPIINRYDFGMKYPPHVDSAIQGGVSQLGKYPGKFGQNFIRTDYSMTLFLSEPKTYEGGELELDLMDEKKLIKLSAGSAVCYSTGISHSVLPVLQGSRIAAIYWFQSMIRDVQLRRLHWDQYCLERKLADRGLIDMAGHAALVRSNILRSLADI